MHSLFSRTAGAVPATTQNGMQNGAMYPYHPDAGMDGIPSPNGGVSPTPRNYNGFPYPAEFGPAPQPAAPTAPPTSEAPPVQDDGFAENQFPIVDPPPAAGVAGIPSGDATNTPPQTGLGGGSSSSTGLAGDVAAPVPGTMQWCLAPDLGYYVECDFLIGTQTIVRRSGILYQVGMSYLVLYDDINGYYTVCDFYSLKFITYHNRRTSPNSPFDAPTMMQNS